FDIHENEAAAFNRARGRREPERAKVLDRIVGPGPTPRGAGTDCADRREQRADEKYTAPEHPAALRSGHRIVLADITHLTSPWPGSRPTAHVPGHPLPS